MVFPIQWSRTEAPSLPQNLLVPCPTWWALNRDCRLASILKLMAKLNASMLSWNNISKVTVTTNKTIGLNC